MDTPSPTEDVSLTFADIEKLLSDHSVDVRGDTIRKLSLMYAENDFVEKEKQIAEDIFRLAAKDVEERIRETLSVNLAVSKELPKDVVKTLATDPSDAVATPVLQYSPALSSEDLIEIVKTGNDARQTAVASRADVEEEVASAIAVHGREQAVQTLVKNEGAQITEKRFIRSLAVSAKTQKSKEASPNAKPSPNPSPSACWNTRRKDCKNSSFQSTRSIRKK